MKHILLAAAAVSLLGATAATAQDHWRGGGNGDGAPPQPAPQAQPQPHAQPRAPAQPQAQGGAGWQGRGDVGRGNRGPVNGATAQGQWGGRAAQGQWSGRAVQGDRFPADRGQVDRGQWRGGDNRFAGDRGQLNGYRQGPVDRGQWSGDRSRYNGGADNRRYDNGRQWSGARDWNGRVWQGRDYRHNWNAERRYRVGGYDWPRGWGYRRYSYGQFLPSIFFGEDYWLDDWNEFDLAPPPPGTVWVRYGPDAVLVDEYTGEVIQVVYGMFY